MKTILITEDDSQIRRALTIRLEAAGYAVRGAPDGFRGFMSAAGQRPDLILMDICLPVGDGLAVTESLRNVGLGGIPVIFITASNEKNLARRARKLGAAGFFRKPFDWNQLLAAVRCALEPNAAARAGAPAEPRRPQTTQDERIELSQRQ